MYAAGPPPRGGCVGAAGVPQPPEHRIDGAGPRLGEQALDELNLRIGRDVSSLVREDVESLMAAVHPELSVVTKAPEFLPRGREEVPVVVLVFPDLALKEDVDAGDARVPERLEDELTARPRNRGGPAAAVRERDH